MSRLVSTAANWLIDLPIFVRWPFKAVFSPPGSSLVNPNPFLIMVDSSFELQKSIGIIGAGAAGLVTAQTLLKDGFKNVEVLTRDKTAGGVWARERLYPGLSLNK